MEKHPLDELVTPALEGLDIKNVTLCIGDKDGNVSVIGLGVLDLGDLALHKQMVSYFVDKRFRNAMEEPNATSDKAGEKDISGKGISMPPADGSSEASKGNSPKRK